MNRPLLCTIVSLFALGLAACASTQGGAGYGAAAPAGSQPTQAIFERDAAYIAYVERTARMRGLDVRWVNPPVKRVVARNDDSEAQ